MDKMQKKNHDFSLGATKPNWKGKRAKLLQEAGLDALSEIDQKSLIKELLEAEEESGLISH